jgi:GNAT superfamily N-acetyltransferase
MKASAQYSIGSAGEVDETGILNCLAAAFEPYRKDYTPAAFADTVLDPAMLGKRMRSMHVLVATPEPGSSCSVRSKFTILGTVAAAVSDDRGHLRGMAVLPELRGSGLAGQLLSAIEAWLREQGCKRVTLNTTQPLHTAMRFYEKNGYARSGKTSDFFGMALVEYIKLL